MRHGQYASWESASELKVLTPCGQQQAEDTAKAIKSQMTGIPPVMKIVASTQIRAIETAEIIHKVFPDVEFQLDPLLIEGNCESPHDRCRFEGRVQTYLKPVDGTQGETTVIVCHANVMRYFVCRQV